MQVVSFPLATKSNRTELASRLNSKNLPIDLISHNHITATE